MSNSNFCLVRIYHKYSDKLAMDRYLFSGVLTLLLLQSAILLGDLGLIPGWSWSFTHSSQSKQMILGKVLSVHQNVRRKESTSIIWENSEKNDSLYAYDSVLTLSNSTTELEIKGDIHLKLQENTLVVLTPPEQEHTGPMRLTFYRGNFRSRSSNESLKLGTKNWSLEAAPGSDLSLRSIDEDNLEVEIVKGEVKLQSQKDQSKTKKLLGGQKATLSKNEIENLQKIDQNIIWQMPQPARIYSFIETPEIKLQWQGSAKSLRISKQQKTQQTQDSFDLNSNQKEISISLNYGTYVTELIGTNGVSQSLTLQVWPAPIIKYLYPLPRDRVLSEQLNTFSWSRSEVASKYLLGFSQDEQFKNPIQFFETEKSFIKTAPRHEGAIYWQVEAFDHDGAKIPAPYASPLFSQPDLLPPPDLFDPIMRAPAKEKKPKIKKRKTSKIDWIYQLLINRAWAANENTYAILFNWQEVKGADHYIIEICDDPGFRSPVVEQKSNLTEFRWHEYEKKVYYWRVAAGRSNQMGKFSEARKLDISTLNSLSDGEISPGVRLEKIIKIQEEKSVQVVSEAPLPKSELESPSMPESNPAPESIMPAADPTPAPEVEVEINYEEAQSKSENPQWQGPLYEQDWQDRYSFGAKYGRRTWTHKQGEDFEVQSIDNAATNIQFSARTAGGYGPSYLFWFEYQSFKLTPFDKAEWPFQEDLTGSEGTMALLRCPLLKNLCYGGEIRLSTGFQRDSFESIKTEQIVTSGPAVHFIVPFNDHLSIKNFAHWTTSPSFSYHELFYQGAFAYEFSFIDDSTLEFSIYIDLGYREGESRKAQTTNTGIGLLFGW